MILIYFVIGVLIFAGIYFYKPLKESVFNTKLIPTIAVQPILTPTSVAFAPAAQLENLKVIHGNFKLSYFYDYNDNQRLILKQIDFKTNKSRDTVLPYLTINNSDENKRGRYLVSPNGKYILRITNKKLEIADLSNSQSLVFKTIHIVAEMKSPGPVPNSEADFANLKDAMWDENGQLYFISDVGADGFTSPFGYYTDLYTANEDGSNKKLVNDHTKEDQKIGFMRSLIYVDLVKKEIYLGGETHGGHNAMIIVINAENGTFVREFKDGRSDFSNPVFNKDFSKAYYEKSLKHEDNYHPTQIYEYNMATNEKKLLYSLPYPTDDNSSYIDDDYFSGKFYLNKSENKLYFQVRDGEKVYFYALDLASGGQPKLLFSDNGSCVRAGVSINGEYILFVCEDKKAKNSEYLFYQVAGGKKLTFYKGGDINIQLINFE